MSVPKQNKMWVAMLSAVVLFGAGCSSDNNGGGPVVAVPALATATGNTTTAPVQASASNANNPDAAASASVPQNVTLTTADGQTVSGENVVVVVEAFDGSEASEKVVAGGTTFSDSSLAEKMGAALNTPVSTNEAVTLDIAGYANVNVSAGGQSIKSFSPPVTITIKTTLPPGTQVAIISVDENTAFRQFEGTAQVDNNGNVVIQTDHLTAIVVVGGIRNTNNNSGGQGSTGR